MNETKIEEFDSRQFHCSALLNGNQREATSASAK